MSDHPLVKHILGIATMLVVNDLEKFVAFYRDKLGYDYYDPTYRTK